MGEASAASQPTHSVCDSAVGRANGAGKGGGIAVYRGHEPGNGFVVAFWTEPQTGSQGASIAASQPAYKERFPGVGVGMCQCGM